MSEVYYTGNQTRKMFDREHQEAINIFNDLKLKFPWIRLEDYFSFTTPMFHEILCENVVTCCMPHAWTEKSVGGSYVLGNRKFCLDSGASFLRLYSVYQDASPVWMPSSAQVMFVGTNHEEFGRPFPALASSFTDLYFKGDPDQIEAAFDLPRRRGAYETLYGVTVVNAGMARIKQYIYDEQGGFSDWDVIWFMYCKRLGLTHLFRP